HAELKARLLERSREYQEGWSERLDRELAGEVLVSGESVLDQNSLRSAVEQMRHRHATTTLGQRDDEAVRLDIIDDLVEAFQRAEDGIGQAADLGLDGVVDDPGDRIAEVRPRLDLGYDPSSERPGSQDQGAVAKCPPPHNRVAQGAQWHEQPHAHH